MKKTFILLSVCEFVGAVHQAPASHGANQLRSHTSLLTPLNLEMEN